MSDQLVLAIEPDLRQAAIVKRIVREKVLADVAVVDSRDAAIEAMRTCMPDVLLLSALLSPRDEDELITHLKTLENAGHLQTHTIPQLASALQPGDERGGRGLLSAFRRKKDPGPASGCDPDLFADEIRVFLKRAAEKKLELQNSDHAAPDMRPSPAGTRTVAAPDAGAASTPQASSWSSPFEWKPGASWSRSAPTPDASDPSSLIADPGSLISHPGSLISNPGSLISHPESLVAHPETLVAHPESLVAHPESPVAHPESLVAHPESLVAHPESLVAHPESLVATPAPAAPMADPPAPLAEPVIAATTGPEEGRARHEATRKRAARDAGFRMRDAGFRIRDSGSAIKDQGLVWLRREAAAPETADGPDDVRALLSTLAVPSAIASVSYPRGCRIRRVRVPAVPDSEPGDAAGAMLASRGTAAGHRDRRPSA